MTMEKKCNHVWLSNSGNGGTPIYTVNRQVSPKPVMHVKCSKCGTRTWVTKEQWE